MTCNWTIRFDSGFAHHWKITVSKPCSVLNFSNSITMFKDVPFYSASLYPGKYTSQMTVTMSSHLHCILR